MSENFLVVPLRAVPAQELQIVLSGQNCSIRVFAKQTFVPTLAPGQIPTDPPVYEEQASIFLDLYVAGNLLLGGVLCLANVLIVRNAYLDFVGDLAFVDTTGAGADPEYTGLGTRWLLTYWPGLN